MQRLVLTLAAFLGLTTLAAAQTRPLPPPEIGADNSIRFGNALKLGKREGGKTILTPDAVLGDGSGLNVLPSASATAGTLAKIISDKANAADPSFSNTAKVTGTGANSGIGCSSFGGQFATDGTSSWQPNCFGNWLASTQAIPILPTRGTARKKDTNGNDTSEPETNVFANSLIQSKADGSQQIQPNGQVINVDVVGGTFSDQGKGNVTGLSVFGRQRPGPNGERPAPFWSINTDQVIAPGSGNVQSWGIELDINNQNADCAPGSGKCLVAHIWTNGGFGFPITAFLYGGGAHTYTYNGNVTTNGTTITWNAAPYTDVSGKQQASMKFGPSIKTITIDGVLYRVNYRSETELDSYKSLPTNSSPVRYNAYIQATHNGVFFNGYEQTADNDAWFNTAAMTGIKISGFHHYGIDTSADTSIVTAFRAGAYQNICMNTDDACFSYVGNNAIQWKSQGRELLQLTGTTNAPTDFVNISNSAANGPSISAASSSGATVPLNLFGANNGGVKANGTFYTTGTIFTGNTATTGIGGVLAGMYLDGSAAAVRAPSVGGTVLFQDFSGTNTYATFSQAVGATLPANLNVNGTYYAKSIAGVSCNGQPTTNYRVTDGIVTRC